MITKFFRRFGKQPPPRVCVSCAYFAWADAHGGSLLPREHDCPPPDPQTFPRALVTDLRRKKEGP